MSSHKRPERAVGEPIDTRRWSCGNELDVPDQPLERDLASAKISTKPAEQCPAKFDGHSRYGRLW